MSRNADTRDALDALIILASYVVIGLFCFAAGAGIKTYKTTPIPREFTCQSNVRNIIENTNFKATCSTQVEIKIDIDSINAAELIEMIDGDFALLVWQDNSFRIITDVDDN